MAARTSRPKEPLVSAAALRRVQRLLLAWYQRQARDLPWRQTRDPYAVLVSEVMLQQTQVARVQQRYPLFLQRFPDVQALADASAAQVLTAWQGLGYNRRALNLHAAARAVVHEHGGRFPQDLDSLTRLPGVGGYTARALLAFAFHHDAAPVDTNVARVLSRALANAPLGRAAVQRLADRAVPPGRPTDWSNAVMDLGATVCVARGPACAACPLERACAWRRDGGADPAAQGALRPRPQAAFKDSDRFHRGRLVDALRAGPVAATKLAQAAQLDDLVRLTAITEGLVRDGLAHWHGSELRLPD